MNYVQIIIEKSIKINKNISSDEAYFYAFRQKISYYFYSMTISSQKIQAFSPAPTCHSGQIPMFLATILT